MRRVFMLYIFFKDFLCGSRQSGGQRLHLLSVCVVPIFILFGVSCERPRLVPQDNHEHAFLPKQDVGLHLLEGFQWKVNSSDKEGKLQKTDWFEASSLKMEDLSRIRSLRIKTAERGEEVKSSNTQGGISIDPVSTLSFNKPYYLLDYSILDVKISKKDSPESVKTDPQKLLLSCLEK